MLFMAAPTHRVRYARLAAGRHCALRLIDGAAAVVPVTLRLLSANCGALLSATALV